MRLLYLNRRPLWPLIADLRVRFLAKILILVVDEKSVDVMSAYVMILDV
jgi:hypothetical protein